MLESQRYSVTTSFRVKAVLLVIAYFGMYISVKAASLATSNDTKTVLMTPGQVVIETVPLEDRTSFILMHLEKALNEASGSNNDAKALFSSQENSYWRKTYEQQFSFVPVYDDFDKDLLNWVKVRFEVDNDGIQIMLKSRDRFCTINGVCYDQNDIGSYCCPF